MIYVNGVKKKQDTDGNEINWSLTTDKNINVAATVGDVNTVIRITY